MTASVGAEAVEGSVADRNAVALGAYGVTVRFGGLTALSNVTLEVAPGKIAGLVGPNGAGKSTLLAVLSGLLRPNAGEVWLQGADVTASSPRSRARRGLARTFQQPELFLGLTVREHLVLAHRARLTPHRLWRDMFDPRALLRPSASESERVGQLLEQLRLTQVAEASVGSLPLGVLRLVEAGRALASEPKVLILDEPLSGLDVAACENLMDIFRRVRAESESPISLVIVEHDVAAVLSLSDVVYVLDFGERIAVGRPDDIRNDPAVRAAYLGDNAPLTRSASPAAGGRAPT